MSSACKTCPAAFLVAGATRDRQAVVCRIDSTTRGQRNARSGPVAIVRPTKSPVAYYGLCLNGQIQASVDEIRELAEAASPAERAMAEAAARSSADLSYDRCTSWRAAKHHRDAARAADQPGKHRTHVAI